MSAIDVPATVGAFVAAATPLGAAIGWLWGKVEKRFAGIEEKLALCEKREGRCAERAARQLTVIELLWNALELANPADRALKRSKHLLDELKRDATGDQS